MTVQVTLQRSESVAEHYGFPAGERDLDYGQVEGEWVLFTHGDLMDQSGKEVVVFDIEQGVYRTSDDEPWSDIIISFTD